MKDINNKIESNINITREDQLTILKSIADIYYSMHLIDLNSYETVEYEAKSLIKQIIESTNTNDARKMMAGVMHATMSDAYLEMGLKFTDVETLGERMKDKKFISMDLLGRNVGWIRLAFITTKADENGVPQKVICTTQIVDAEKKKEERLIKESNTDELTGCYNRRAYEDDLMNYPSIPTEENFVYIAMDLNGLKNINDTLGHDAGDELITEAVKCMRQCIGNYGRIYRTGGDEFVAMIFADERTLEEIKEDFEHVQSMWTGKHIKELSISTGYVTKREFPDMKVVDMAKIADKRMYEAKAQYYSSKGIDRRGQVEAHTVLCSLYTKILKINITDDTYKIVKMDESEKIEEMGFSGQISSWLHEFGKSGQVHEDDLDEYLKKTDINYLRQYFGDGKTILSIKYRRNIAGSYRPVVMDIAVAGDYAPDNQRLFLYVKAIDY